MLIFAVFFIIMITNFHWITKWLQIMELHMTQQWNPYLMTALKYLLRYFS